MKLDNIIEELEIKEIVGKDKNNIHNIEISDIIYDSRKAKENTIFVALFGYTMDGHNYVQSSYERGSRVFLVENLDKFEIKEDALYIVVENTRVGLSKISHNFFNKPSKEMTVIGITGTKGKTTVSHFIRDVLEKNGNKVGILGTIGCFYGEYSEPTENTTPESYEIHRIMRTMLDRGFNYMVMEVSSGGIMNHRVDDIDFDYGIFLNLSLDHVGTNEHPTFQHYKECKGELFKRSKVSILNRDDNEFEFFKSKSKSKVITYSVNNEDSDYIGRQIIEGKTFKEIGLTFNVLDNKNNTYDKDIKLPLPGIYNIYNALATISLAKELGLPQRVIKDALSTVKVTGRFDIFSKDETYFVIDYAHNGTSIESVLKTIKEHNPNKVFLIVGSVGGRSHGRRKEIGEASRDYIDVVILTSDNQNYEDPDLIIEEMKEPFINTKVEVYGQKDRREAIKMAYTMAGKNDVILVAGKGHERYNLENGIKVPYSDHEVVKSIVNK